MTLVCSEGSSEETQKGEVVGRELDRSVFPLSLSALSHNYMYMYMYMYMHCMHCTLPSCVCV